MSFCLIVSVEEGTKILIKPKVPNISDCITFRDVYKKITLNVYEQRNIEIYGWVDTKSKWIPIDKECFDDELKVIINLKFTKIKYKIIPSFPSPIPHILQMNLLNIIMQTVEQSQLPQLRRPEIIVWTYFIISLLYFFKQRMLGEKEIYLYVDVGKTFIEWLTQVLWYIDSHLPKFKKHGCNLPQLFAELLNTNIYSKLALYPVFSYFKTQKN